MVDAMTQQEAKRIVGNQASVFVRNMAVALSFHSWANTPEEWQRLEAACVVLGRSAPRIARNALATFKSEARS